MADWADELQTKILINAGVNHLDSLRARLGSSIADALRIARAEALEQAAKVAQDFPAHSHGSLATAPAQAAEQAADEIAAAIEALIGEKPEP